MTLPNYSVLRGRLSRVLEEGDVLAMLDRNLSLVNTELLSPLEKGLAEIALLPNHQCQLV